MYHLLPCMCVHEETQKRDFLKKEVQAPSSTTSSYDG